MRFDVITLFPELFEPHTKSGVTRRAYDSGAIELELWPLRDHADDVRASELARSLRTSASTTGRSAAGPAW